MQACLVKALLEDMCTRSRKQITKTSLRPLVHHMTNWKLASYHLMVASQTQGHLQSTGGCQHANLGTQRIQAILIFVRNLFDAHRLISHKLLPVLWR